MKTKKAISIFLVCVLLFSLTACTGSKKVSLQFYAMNTLMQCDFYGVSEKDANTFLAEAIAEATEMENLFSVTDAQSEIGKLNGLEKGGSLTVGDDTAKIIKKALQATEITDGAFDITVMPLVSLWGFDSGEYRLPSEKAIQSALTKIVASEIAVDGNTVTVGENTKVTLGGIAKGYLGDRLFEKFYAEGVTAVLSLGGNVVTVGEKANGQKWSIAVKDPQGDGAFCTVKVEGGCSVVTSGGYERNFTENGKTYHHILDPKTGYPAENGVLSVTVISHDGTLCDAFSTGFFVMGKEKSAELMNELDGFDCVIVCSDNTVLTSLSADEFILEKGSAYTVEYLK